MAFISHFNNRRRKTHRQRQQAVEEDERRAALVVADAGAGAVDAQTRLDVGLRLLWRRRHAADGDLVDDAGDAPPAVPVEDDLDGDEARRHQDDEEAPLSVDDLLGGGGGAERPETSAVLDEEEDGRQALSGQHVAGRDAAAVPLLALGEDETIDGTDEHDDEQQARRQTGQLGHQTARRRRRRAQHFEQGPDVAQLVGHGHAQPVHDARRVQVAVADDDAGHQRVGAAAGHGAQPVRPHLPAAQRRRRPPPPLGRVQLVDAQRSIGARLHHLASDDDHSDRLRHPGDVVRFRPDVVRRRKTTEEPPSPPPPTHPVDAALFFKRQTNVGTRVGAVAL